MFRLARITKAYEEAGSFNEQVNLFGFIDDQVFLTKSGDVGVVLSVGGVDYECLDSPAADSLVKRIESAFKVFDERFRIYQYFFKRDHAEIPHHFCQNPIVNTAIETRIEYLRAKAHSLYCINIFYVILFEGFRHRSGLLSAFSALTANNGNGLTELRRLLSTTVGVPDKTIQAILRHSNLSTTMNSYVKSVPQDAVAAMQAFEKVCRKKAPRRSIRKALGQLTHQGICTPNAPQIG